jgi:hypothetical protein
MFIAKGSADLKEMYLISARPCAEGGFVPTELYETEFSADVPSQVRPTELQLESGPYRVKHKVVLGHLKLTDLRDARGPVAITELKKVHTIVGQGGAAPLLTKAPLSIDRIKSMLGRKLTDRRTRHVSSVDVAELNKEFAQPRRYSGWAWTTVAVVGLAVFTIILRKRMTAVMLAVGLVGVASQGGCAPPARPLFSLTVSFDRPHVLVGREQGFIPLFLIAQNDGNVPLRVFKVDGGCTCRQVDQSLLPAVIRPGEALKLAVKLDRAPRAEMRLFQFNFETDQGSHGAQAPLLLLTSHSLEPDVVSSPVLHEGEECSWMVVHRVVCEAESATYPLTLAVPPEIAVTKVGSTRGRVNGAPHFLVEETNYRVTLRDKSLGRHKAVIAFKQADGQTEISLPVVWQRFEYLSSVPDRVYIGQRPSRVFLRCPDDKVELKRILSAPTGIKAVVASALEVTLSLDDQAPQTINGFVMVETTASTRPPLRIPVVRFPVGPAKG